MLIWMDNQVIHNIFDANIIISDFTLSIYSDNFKIIYQE